MKWIIFILILCEYYYIFHAKEILLIDVCRDPSDEKLGQVIEVVLGATVHLECNFCNIQDDFQAKLWYYKARGNNLAMKEIELPMDTNITECKISMTVSHRLVIERFDLKDSGIYGCHGYHEDYFVFVYVLDGIFNNNYSSSIKIGKMSQWHDFNKTKLEPLNRKFDQSEEEPFRSLREDYGISLRVSTVWKSWGPCMMRGKHKGVRSKIGNCQLTPVKFEESLKNSTVNPLKKEVQYFLEDSYDISCHSLTLNKTFPEVSRLVRSLHNFEISEPCDATSPTADVSAQSRSKQNNYKHKITKHIGENSHLTLVCPEIALESSVEWFKDNELLDASFRNNMGLSEKEPPITIDSFNSLYILHATKKEEGLYSCSVDGEKKEEFYVVVVPKSKLINQEFIRYSIYLGFVLSLTLSCYCAGICVAWHRRSSFASPLQAKDRRSLANHLLERERLLQ